MSEMVMEAVAVATQRTGKTVSTMTLSDVTDSSSIDTAGGSAGGSGYSGVGASISGGAASYLGSALNIQLPKFEGPLALLLYLIRKEEMDIFDIKINEITKQYLEYIKLMREFDIDAAGDFIAMASTLLQIKSRMLLPNYNEHGEVIEAEDPRKELVQKLLEYQKYQEAAKSLMERPWLGRDVWARGFREKMDAPEEDIVLEENALFSLIAAYRGTMRGMQKRVHKVAAKLQSIASRVLEIKEFLIVGLRTPISAMITDLSRKRAQTLITFLSVLELAKMGFVNLFQSEVYGELYVESKKVIEADAISRVEEYESHNAEAVADSLMVKAIEEEIAEHEQEVVIDMDGSGHTELTEAQIDELTQKLSSEASDLESEFAEDFAAEELTADELAADLAAEQNDEHLAQDSSKSETSESTSAFLSGDNVGNVEPEFKLEHILLNEQQEAAQTTLQDEEGEMNV